MKQQWQKLVARIDARTLRERTIIFAAAALALVTLVNQMMIDPLFKRQKIYTQQISQDQAKIAELRAQILTKARAQAIDPDQENRERLRVLSEELNRMQGELNKLQKGLVSPDKMSDLLENLLKRNGRLRLIALKTLPAASLLEPEAATKGAGDGKGAENASQSKDKQVQPTEAAVNPVYKHGVELTVQGSYLDMVSYMAELEALPWQLFWGRARLEAKDFTKATLTLTLYTLSLDRKWLNI